MKKHFCLVGCVLLFAWVGIRRVDASPASASVSFQGPQQTFGLQAALRTPPNSNNVNIFGNGTFRAWLGLFHSNFNFTVPNQTLTLDVVGDPFVVNTNPSGNADIGFDDQTAIPATVGPLNINIQNGSVLPITLAQVEADFDVSAGILGTLDGDLFLNASGNVKNIRFESSAVGFLSPGAFVVPGSLKGGLDAVITGNAQVQVVVEIPFSLGTILTLDDPNLLDMPIPNPGLPGLAAQMDLQLHDPIYPHDYFTSFGIPQGTGLSFDLPFVIGPETINQTWPNPSSGNSGLTALNLTYTFNFGLNLGDPHFNLEGTITNVLQNPFDTDVYRTWNNNQNFATGVGTATGIGPDGVWSYGVRSGLTFTPFNQVASVWYLGGFSPAWIPTSGTPSTEKPGIAKAMGGVPPTFTVPNGEVGVHTESGPQPTVVRWSAPPGIGEVFVSWSLWDADTTDNNLHTITIEHRNASNVLVGGVPLYSSTLNNLNTNQWRMSNFAPTVAVSNGDYIDFIMQPASSDEMLGTHFYVAKSVRESMIAGTVFFDTNGNLFWDGNPPEYEQSGVTLFLYRDENADSQLDGGDTLLSSQVTPGAGGYRFVVPSLGDYLVVLSVPTLPPGMSLTSSAVIGVSISTPGELNDFNSFPFYFTPTPSPTPTLSPTPTASPTVSPSPTPNAVRNWRVYQ